MHEDDVEEGIAEYFGDQQQIPESFDEMSEMEAVDDDLAVENEDLDTISNRLESEISRQKPSQSSAQPENTVEFIEEHPQSSRRPLRPLAVPHMNILIMAVGTRFAVWIICSYLLL